MTCRFFSAVLLSAALLAGCDAFSSEPTYGGLSTEAFNYTPYNLSQFVITDKYGNKASGGGDLMPGSGEGRLSCCYILKGTEFTVKWRMYDADKASQDLYAPIDYINKEAQVHIPPTKLKGEAGVRILGVHFYPDDHVEFEFLDKIAGKRIFFSQVGYWLENKLGEQVYLNGLSEAQAFRRTSRVIADGWKKYKFENSEDLKQYIYFNWLNPQFDEHPEVKKIIAETQGKPGAFGAAMEKLPSTVVDEIKRTRATTSVTKEAAHG